MILPTRPKLNNFLSVATLALIASLFRVSPTLAAVDNVCYLVSDRGGGNGGDDFLVKLNTDTNQFFEVSRGTGTERIEAAAAQPGTNILFAANQEGSNGRLGTIDLITGTFDPLDNLMGSGSGIRNGESVNATFADPDGLAFDPTDGSLYASIRTGDGSAPPDILIEVDPTTGQHIPNAFGSGIDFVEIQPQNSRNDIDGIAIDSNGTMYGIANQGGGGNQNLVTIDKTDGTTTLVGTIKEGSTNVGDVEDLAFDVNGQLYISTGNNGDRSDRLYDLNTSTAAATNPRPITIGGDYEASGCFLLPPADVSLNKTIDNSSPSVGDTVTFSLTLTNDAAANDNLYSDANNIVVEDVLPAGLEFDSLVTTPAGSTASYDLATRTLTWNVNEVLKGDNIVLQFRASATTPGSVTNTAEVTALREFDVDSVPNNNNDSEDDQDSVTLIADPGLDYGDAPDYTTAQIRINSDIYLGSTAPDSDTGSWHDGTDDSENATDDDTNDTPSAITAGDDEEDSVAFGPLDITMAGNSFNQDVRVTNNDAQPAYVRAWIDFDRDGTFDPNEVSNEVTVAGNAGDTTANLSFSIPTDISSGPSFARVIVSDTPNIPLAGQGTGEIEDHIINIGDENICNFLPNTTFSAFDFSNVSQNIDNGPNANQTSAVVTYRNAVVDLDGIPLDVRTTVNATEGKINKFGNGDIDGRDASEWYLAIGNSSANSDSSAEVRLEFFIAGTNIPRSISGQFATGDIDGVDNKRIESLLLDTTDFSGFALDGGTTIDDPYPEGNYTVFKGTGDRDDQPDSFVTYTFNNLNTVNLIFRITDVDNFRSAGFPINGRIASEKINNANCNLTAIPTDYSDAPTDSTSYGVAAHAIASGIQLGSAIDADSGSLASADADGDGADDDGVTIPALTAGRTATITANVSGTGGYLQGWIDWDGNGSFDTGEEVATDLQDNGSFDTDNTVGTISFDITVPAEAITTTDTFARFRWSTTQGLNTTDAANNGEVEDYKIAIAAPPSVPPPADSCPSTPIGLIDVGVSTSTPSGSGVGRQVRYPNVATVDGKALDLIGEVLALENIDDLITLGITDSLPRVTLPSIDASEPIGTIGTAEIKYTFVEQGTTTPVPVSFEFEVSDIDNNLRPTGTSRREFIVFSTSQFQDYFFADPTQMQAELNLDGILFSNSVPFNGNPNANPGNTVKFLINNRSSFTITFGVEKNTSDRRTGDIGFPLDGAILPQLGKCDRYDYGDAPDSDSDTAANNYQTLLANGGPAHKIIDGLFLGPQKPDADNNGTPTANADGDDLSNTAATFDDEDGVQLAGSELQGKTLEAGDSITLDIATQGSGVLNAWMDWNNDGDFLDADEQIATNAAERGAQDSDNDTPGIQLNVTVPRSATVSNIFARFRYSTDTDLIPTGTANDGEVEDYQIAIAAASDPNLLLVKRITAINPGSSNEVQYNSFVDDDSNDDGDFNNDPNDDPNWPTDKDRYLRGATSVADVQPGDEIEYTIYFLSNGEEEARNVKICDVIPDNMSFVSNSYDGDSGIEFLNSSAPNATATNLSNFDDADAGRFYAPGAALPTVGDPPTNLCQKVDSAGNIISVGAAENINGAIVVEIDSLPEVTSPATPVNSYGFIRFRAKVK